MEYSTLQCSTDISVCGSRNILLHHCKLFFFCCLNLFQSMPTLSIHAQLAHMICYTMCSCVWSEVVRLMCTELITYQLIYSGEAQYYDHSMRCTMYLITHMNVPAILWTLYPNKVILPNEFFHHTLYYNAIQHDQQHGLRLSVLYKY